jgi:hypothetical protein
VDGAASLLDADPGVARAIGRDNAAAIGHRPILPVLAASAGAWTPPTAARLGPQTLALAVLDGLLLEDATSLHGPGDMIAPWGSTWVAATRVRLAVIGSAYLEPLRPWPAIAHRVHARAAAPTVTVPPPGDSVQRRLAALLWSLALRWGSFHHTALVLPSAVDLRALRLLLDVDEAQAAGALTALRDDGVVECRERSLWLSAGTERTFSRRDTLRARAALQVALARRHCDDSADLCDALELVLRRHDDLRGARPRSAGVGG